MKVKVFICTLAFLHIKEEILMKRKNYKVKVKLIFETTMDHSQTSMQKAQEDVNRVLTDYLKDYLRWRRYLRREWKCMCIRRPRRVIGF